MASLKKVLRKLFRRTRTQDRLPPHVTLGRRSYGLTRSMVLGASAEAPLTIGSFCSIGPEVMFFSRVDHPTQLPSTYPFRTLMLHPQQGNRDAVTKGPIRIGNDVWIGARAMIMSGVTIGDGAIVGAGAVVARDVPPYAIVVGNPGRVVRYRFTEDQITRLLALRWWTWDDARIAAYEDHFYGDVAAFLDRAERDAPV